MGFLYKNTPNSERALAKVCTIMAQEAINLNIPAATDKLIVDVWAHQNGKDVFIFDNAAINAPTVIKCLLANTVGHFWQGVPILLTTTFLLLWSCVSDHGSIQAYLKNTPLTVVVLCFEGPAMLKECINTRNQLLTENTSLEAAEWLVIAVCSTTSSKSRDVCKPVVVEKDNVFRVQQHNAM